MGYDHGNISAIAHRAAEQLLHYAWKVWFWGDSVGLEGILDASELLDAKAYESFVYGLIKGWIGRREPPRALDYTAPGVGLVRIYERTLDPILIDVAKLHGDYLAGFRRTKYGAYLRYLDPDFDLFPELSPPLPDTQRGLDLSVGAKKSGPCAFVDNMHFDGPFYAKLYRATREDRWRQLAIANILPHIRLLFDQDYDLFHHFWIEETGLRNGVLWGRGQGWALLGIVHTLENLDEDDPSAPELREILTRQSKALAGSQDRSGHWHTVIDDPSSYLETSVSAFVVDGFSRAICRGWLDDSYRSVIERAFSALLNSVRADGTLDGVSYETYPSLSAEHYKKMPRGAMVPWGQGPLLAALRSYSELRRN